MRRKFSQILDTLVPFTLLRPSAAARLQRIAFSSSPKASTEQCVYLSYDLNFSQVGESFQQLLLCVCVSKKSLSNLVSPLYILLSFSQRKKQVHGLGHALTCFFVCPFL